MMTSKRPVKMRSVYKTKRRPTPMAWSLRLAVVLSVRSRKLMPIKNKLLLMQRVKPSVLLSC